MPELRATFSLVVPSFRWPSAQRVGRRSAVPPPAPGHQTTAVAMQFQPFLRDDLDVIEAPAGPLWMAAT